MYVAKTAWISRSSGGVSDTGMLAVGPVHKGPRGIDFPVHPANSLPDWDVGSLEAVLAGFFVVILETILSSKLKEETVVRECCCHRLVCYGKVKEDGT